MEYEKTIAVLTGMRTEGKLLNGLHPDDNRDPAGSFLFLDTDFCRYGIYQDGTGYKLQKKL